MKLLHTADWHIGQLFHEYDRTFEHGRFLDWLVQTLGDEQVDVLLVSGDVFDLSNPAAASVKMFYTFLSRAVKVRPDIQIIITAGNHDSATRLESPKPLLESSNIHITGTVERGSGGEIDYDKLIVPINDYTGSTKAWCLAIPFLRLGDYPPVADCSNPYTEGVAALYREAYEQALRRKQPGQAIIAMGHLHALHAEVTDLDKPERLIMGGVECIPATAFHRDIRYVALGHIHKAQKIGGNEYIRYPGSPLPLSFSELNYKHQVIVFELEGDRVGEIRSVEVPVSVPLLRIPAQHKPLREAVRELEQLPRTDDGSLPSPYLEVRVLLEGPEPALRHKIETALAGKHVRLTKIDAKYPSSAQGKEEHVSLEHLHELNPADVFSELYQSKYGTPVPEDLLKLFSVIAGEAGQEH